MTLILGIIGMLMTLLLAWRGYRSISKEDQERKRERKRRDGG